MASTVDVVDTTKQGEKKEKVKVKVEKKPLPKLNPTLDLKENPDTIIAIFEMPGLKKSDIKFKLNVNTLTIRAVKRVPKNLKKEQVDIAECNYGVFERTVELPCTVNPKKVKAKFRNGRCLISLQKKDYQKQIKVAVK